MLEAPLTDDERGARQQRRLQLALKSRVVSPDYERGSVLFRSYFGEVAACNPLAVHRELRRRGTQHTLYWAVADYSVLVPEGGIPVLHDSAEWYRLLHEAHFYMDNMHQPMYQEARASDPGSDLSRLPVQADGTVALAIAEPRQGAHPVLPRSGQGLGLPGIARQLWDQGALRGIRLLQRGPGDRLSTQ